MSEKKSFIIFKDSLEIANDLNDEQLGRLFRAIIAHQLGEDYEQDFITKIAFNTFKAQFERDDEKYEKIRLSRIEAGKKGGEAKASNSKQVLASASKSKQSLANVAVSVKGSVKGSVSESVSGKVSDSDSERQTKTPVIKKKPTVSPQAREVFDHWATVMGKDKKRTRLTQERKSCIEKRISEGYDVEQIKQAIEGCAKSAHHMGQNDTGTVYDDLTLICRNGSKIEQFAQNIAKVTPIRRDGVETIDDFKRKSEEQCARIRASGFLDDIL